MSTGDRLRILVSDVSYRLRARQRARARWSRYREGSDVTVGREDRSAVILTDGVGPVTDLEASALASVLTTTDAEMACGPVYERGRPNRVIAAGYELGLDGDVPVRIPLLAGEALRRKWATQVTVAVRPSGRVYGITPTLLDSIVADVGPLESAIVDELRRRGPWAVVWAAAHENAEQPTRDSVEDALSRRDEGNGLVLRVEPPGPGSPGTPCPPPAAIWLGDRAHKHQAGLDRHELMPLVSIRHAASDWGVADRWGDHHFATSVSNAFADMGVGARVVPRHAWEHPFAAREMVVTIRGLVPARPVFGKTNVLWVISHPMDLQPGELQGYDLVAVASKPDHDRIASMTDSPVVTLFQATDQSQFREPRSGDGSVVFIGNSRGVRRRSIDWAIEQDIPVSIYGRGWDDIESDAVRVLGPIDRKSAADRFNSASVVVGDHWDDMRDLGYVSNRAFDVPAAGGLLISDHVKGIEDILPGTITVDSSDDLGRSVRRWLAADEDQRKERIAQVQSEVLQRHTFEHRVRELLEGVREHVPAGNRLVDRILDP